MGTKDRDKLEVKILIATHTKYPMPSDKLYFPIHVGAEGKKDSDGSELDLGYTKDNTGDNISNLNDSFCELTGLYWGWKNLDYDYLGLVHYRRYFELRGKEADLDHVLTYEQLEPYLPEIKIFVPRKRRYYIETLYSHYAHTHYASHLDETRCIIKEKYPDYLRNYDKIVQCRYGYMLNMMIMQKDLMEEYCSWLFSILFELQRRINTDNLSAFQGRFCGRVGEIIFNAWLDRQIEDGRVQNSEIKELPWVCLEKTDWISKGRAFLGAKVFGKKYEESAGMS